VEFKENKQKWENMVRRYETRHNSQKKKWSKVKKYGKKVLIDTEGKSKKDEQKWIKKYGKEK